MYTSPPVTGEYPRLFFSRTDVPALRAKLEHPDCRATWLRLLAACEQMIKPDPAPIYPRHIRAAHLAFAALMTGREDFAQAARTMVRTSLDRKAWGSGVGLATGGCLSNIGQVYDWLYDCLSEEERQAMRTAMIEYGLKPHLEAVRRRDPDTQYYTCNGMCVVNGPVLMASILLEEQVDTREFYSASLLQVRRAIDSHCPDGGYPEGLGYWNYGIRHLLLGVEALRRNKGIDLYHEPFLHTTGDYALHYILPWLTDCSNTADGTHRTHLWAPIAAFAAYHKRPEWQWIARRLLTHDWGMDGESLEYSLFYLIFYDPAVPAEQPEPEQAVHLFSGLQQLALRSDWSEQAIHALWLNGPSNCHHNHLHLNSFTLSAFGERLLIEMGAFDYSNGLDPRRQTAGHNSLLVAGEGQIITTDPSVFCRRLRAGQWGTVFGEFRNLREEAGSVIATGSVINAYAGRLRTFDRTLAFIDKRFFFLHDHIELDRDPPVELEWLFHSAGTIEVRDDDYLFGAGSARLKFVPLDPAEQAVDILRTHSELGYSTILPKKSIPVEPRKCLALKRTCTGPTADFYLLMVPFREGDEPAVRLARRMAMHRNPVYRKDAGFGPIGETETAVDGVSFAWGKDTWEYEPEGRILRRLS